MKPAKAQSCTAFKADVERYAKSLNTLTLAVGIARGDSLIFFSGIGSAAADTQVSITADHIYPIASVTKSFTSVVLQQLEAEDKLSLPAHKGRFINRRFVSKLTESSELSGAKLTGDSCCLPGGGHIDYWLSVKFP